MDRYVLDAMVPSEHARKTAHRRRHDANQPRNAAACSAVSARTARPCKAEEGAIGKLIVEAVILLSASKQSDGGKILRAAAQAYKVDTGKLKSGRNALRDVLKHGGWAKMEAVEAVDRVLEMTERVLNPASHGSATPLYEEEVRRAKRLIVRLEEVLLKAEK